MIPISAATQWPNKSQIRSTSFEYRKQLVKKCWWLDSNPRRPLVVCALKGYSRKVHFYTSCVPNLCRIGTTVNFKSHEVIVCEETTLPTMALPLLQMKFNFATFESIMFLNFTGFSSKLFKNDLIWSNFVTFDSIYFLNFTGFSSKLFKNDLIWSNFSEKIIATTISVRDVTRHWLLRGVRSSWNIHFRYLNEKDYKVCKKRTRNNWAKATWRGASFSGARSCGTSTRTSARTPAPASSSSTPASRRSSKNAARSSSSTLKACGRWSRGTRRRRRSHRRRTAPARCRSCRSRLPPRRSTRTWSRLSRSDHSQTFCHLSIPLLLHVSDLLLVGLFLLFWRVNHYPYSGL